MSKNKILSLSLRILTLLALLFLFPKITYAANLGSTSDIISTSRPSASTPIGADGNNVANGTTSVVDFDNGTVFLASDSANLLPDTGESIATVTISSMSAVNTPAANQRIVYFTGTGSSNSHHKGDVLVTPVSALHTISFGTSTAVPALGKILIQFPALVAGDANNPASPSASTFQFGGLSSTNIKINGLGGAGTFTPTITNPTAGNSPTISLALTGTTVISGGTTVTIQLGCTAISGAFCTASSPSIINPTTNSITAGSARPWVIAVSTLDNNSVTLDSSNAEIATIDSVQVQATVNPSLTVTVAGLAGNANFNTSSGSCTSETASSGIASTATSVNLGMLGVGNINKAGQTITVTTNAQNGYVITATSSGRLLDPANGFFLPDANGGNGLTANDTPVPAIFPASGNAVFGMSPCGTRVTAQWAGGSAIGFGSGAKLSNPWNTGTNAFYSTLATYAGPAVTTDVTVVRYAASVATTTPAGIYYNTFSYVVTPTF